MKKFCFVFALILSVGLGGVPGRVCSAATCPPHSNNVYQRETCISSGHSYHMVIVPGGMDESGKQLYTRCDKEANRMESKYYCRECNTVVGIYYYDIVTHLSIYCPHYGTPEHVLVN